nr:hypothetical protein BaRGS_018566 [Batillaria attramentaria]
MAQQVFIQQDIVKFDINYLGIADSLGHNAPWGSGPNPDVWNDIEIICTFDDEDMFAILDIPRCNVQIKFRPHNPDDEPGPQRKVPGISIETGQNTGFGQINKGRSTAENLIPDPVQCTNSIELFNNCGGGVGPKVEAIRCCHKILKRKKTVKCLGKDNVLQAFNDCLELALLDTNVAKHDKYSKTERALFTFQQVRGGIICVPNMETGQDHLFPTKKKTKAKEIKEDKAKVTKEVKEDQAKEDQAKEAKVKSRVPPTKTFGYTYRLTRIVTPLDRGSEASHCSFEVFAINWISDKGRYYVKAVEIALAIGDFWQQVFTQHDVVKFDVGPDGFIDTENHLAPWGTPPDPFVWNLIQIQCSFDLDENIAILDVPQCDVKIKFRPYNPADEPGAQLRVPGISIEVGQNTGFGEVEEGRFGSSLCGETLVQGDDHKLYLDRAKLLFNTDKSVDQALLYEALRQGIEQKNLVPAAGQLIHNEGHCNESVRLFNNLCDSLLERIGAINACHRILKRKKTVRSLGSDNALKAFNLCLQAYCDCDADAWDQLKDMFNDIANRNIPHGVKNSVKKRCGNE